MDRRGAGWLETISETALDEAGTTPWMSSMSISSTTDEPDSPPRPASKLVGGLAETWQVMQEALTRFTPTDLQLAIETEHQGRTYTFSRGWVVWHVIEHDLHHGGEIAYSLGMHGLEAPDI